MIAHYTPFNSATHFQAINHFAFGHTLGGVILTNSMHRKDDSCCSIEYTCPFQHAPTKSTTNLIRCAISISFMKKKEAKGKEVTLSSKLALDPPLKMSLLQFLFIVVVRVLGDCIVFSF